MQPQPDWVGLVAALIAFITVLTAILSAYNARQVASIKAEQKRVADNLLQVTVDGKELRQFLINNRADIPPRT